MTQHKGCRFAACIRAIALTIFAAPLGGCSQPAAPPSATIDETTWLTVYPDHFELLGRKYSSQPELVSALRAVKDPSRLAVNSIVRGDDEPARSAIAQKLSEARAAVKEAGLAPLQEVHNEVF
jgi:hypothetical protein